MTTTVKIRDESTTGEALAEFMLELLTERVTVRELIRSRVFQEVKDYNAKPQERFQGLVRPTDAEATLNGYRMKSPRRLDSETQFQRALKHVEDGWVVVVVDGDQVDDLDRVVTLKPDATVTFLRLLPLVGG